MPLVQYPEETSLQKDAIGYTSGHLFLWVSPGSTVIRFHSHTVRGGRTVVAALGRQLDPRSVHVYIQLLIHCCTMICNSISEL